jgi:hypothetical protein
MEPDSLLGAIRIRLSANGPGTYRGDKLPDRIGSCRKGAESCWCRKDSPSNCQRAESADRSHHTKSILSLVG